MPLNILTVFPFALTKEQDSRSHILSNFNRQMWNDQILQWELIVYTNETVKQETSQTNKDQKRKWEKQLPKANIKGLIY